MSPTDRLAIAHALGENLVLMHQLTWPVPGHYDVTVDTIAPFPAGFTPWITADIRTWLAQAQRHSARTTARDVAWVEALLRAARPALTEPLQPHFVMNDYKEQNTAVSRTDHGWHVTGVFDLMEGFFGDGEMDLVRPVAGYLEEDPQLAQAFLMAYVERMPVRPGFAERFAVYMLRDRLIIWEYVQRQDLARIQPAPRRLRTPWDTDITLQDWVEPYLREARILTTHVGRLPF